MLLDMVNSVPSMIIFGSIIAQMLRNVVKHFGIHGKEEFYLVSGTIAVTMVVSMLLQGFGIILVAVASVWITRILLSED